MFISVKVMAKQDGYAQIAEALEESLDENTAPILGPNKNPREKAIPTSAFSKNNQTKLDLVFYHI